MQPFEVVKQFERELCNYSGARFAVTTTSCTMAILLAVKWNLRGKVGLEGFDVSIPKKTYCGVGMSIIHAGGRPVFRDEDWVGHYQLAPLPVVDSARFFSDNMFHGINYTGGWTRGLMVCVSFHWSKTLGIQQGGAILHDNPEADEWLRRARFDGRKEGVHPKDDKDMIIGYHAYMSPETAAAGLVRLNNLPKHNAPLPWGPGTNSDYPDLSTMECFK